MKQLRRVIWAAAFAGAPAASAPAAPAGASATSGGNAACSAASLASAETEAAARAACAARLLDAPGDAATLSTDSLYATLRALLRRATTQAAAADVQTLRLVVRELEIRSAMRPMDRRNVVDLLLMNGRVDEAKVAAQAVASTRGLVLPRLEPLATPAAADAARYWVWDTGANVLRERAVDLSRGTHVVVISSANCHFCDELASALPKDPALSAAFRQHAIWISRPDGGFDLKAVQRWDRRHPQTPLVTVFDLAGWPHERTWATPQFYFMRDGVVVQTVRGYQPSRVDEIRQGFAAVGAALDTPR